MFRSSFFLLSSILILTLVSIPDVLPFADATFTARGFVNLIDRDNSQSSVYGPTICVHSIFSSTPLKLSNGNDACDVVDNSYYQIDGIVNPSPGSLTIKAKLSTQNDDIKVENWNSQKYNDETEPVRNVPDGVTATFQNLMISGTSGTQDKRGFWLMNDLQKAHDYFDDEVNEEIKLVTLKWQDERNVAITNYDDSVIELDGRDRGKELDGADVHNEWTVLHEYGHHIMDHTYDGVMPTTGDECKSHSFTKISGQNCAWVEGWADFVPHLVTDKSSLKLLSPPDHIFDVEEPSYSGISGSSIAFEKTEETEGRVAATLWDLHDSGRTDESVKRDFDSYIWKVFEADKKPARYADNFKEFQNNWDIEHSSSAEDDLREVMVLNTITYLAVPDSVTDLDTPSVTTNSVTLTWSVSDNNGFSITKQEIVQKHGLVETIIPVAVDETIYTVPSLLDNNSYSFNVRVYNEHGFSSSNLKSIVTVQIPNPPKNPQSTDVTDSKVQISWGVPDSGNFVVTGYEVLRAASPFVSLANVTSSTTSYVDETVLPNTDYQYKINTHSSHAVSVSSQTVNVKTAEETTAPRIDTINRESPTTEETTNNVLTFRVTFDEDVTGVNQIDFETGDTATSSVTGFTANSAVQYDVSVTVTESGIMSIGLKSTNHGIKDTASTPNPLTDTTPKTTTQTFTVTLPDNTPPVITTPKNITAEATGNLTIIPITNATATDVSLPITIIHNATDSIKNGFQLGVTMIKWSATDSANNTAHSIQKITIHDTTPPVITLIGDDSISIPFDSSYLDAGATATDIHDGNLTSSIIINNPTDTSTSGNYTITYNVADSSANAAEQKSRTVTVLPKSDTLMPPIESGVYKIHITLDGEKCWLQWDSVTDSYGEKKAKWDCSSGATPDSVYFVK